MTPNADRLDPADAALDDLLPLTPVVFHILVALSADVRHGYDVARRVEDATDGAIRMGPGTLYGSLRRMQDDGLIAEADDPGREGAHADRRRYYRVTERGRAALSAETARLARAVELARSALGGGGG
ncbi:MAG: PadR family transcriptional regulator [Gemmatimonadota bacterium]|jgi:DNA-binding PadR family transcriptional regulator